MTRKDLSSTLVCKSGKYQYVQQATAKGKAIYQSRKDHSLLCVLRYTTMQYECHGTSISPIGVCPELWLHHWVQVHVWHVPPLHGQQGGSLLASFPHLPNKNWGEAWDILHNWCRPVDAIDHKVPVVTWMHCLVLGKGQGHCIQPCPCLSVHRWFMMWSHLTSTCWYYYSVTVVEILISLQPTLLTHLHTITIDRYI